VELDLFAVTAPGLEPLVVAELQELGIRADAESGGASWKGDLEGLYAANLHLRVASRVLLRIADFRARTFFELERHAARIPWERYVPPGRPVRLRVSSRKSRLYHERAIEERFLRWIGERLGSVSAEGPGEGEPDENEEEGESEQLFVVRFVRDHCVVSADASGALLHRRGYRQAVAKAPLRETIAAAMLLASGWNRTSPLLDPFCGSGTIPIEAALLARGIAPGLANPDLVPRAYAFQRWAGFDERLWTDVVGRAVSAVRPAADVAIHGSDRDAGAIEAAMANAERAGVANDLSLHVRPLSSIEPPPRNGWLITNPPYGVRVGERDPLRDLYTALGRLARDRFAGWNVAFLSAEPALERQTGLDLREVLRTRNGGIDVRLLAGMA
jgi:putative N6-adenine-specific DNA methylase